MIVALVQRGIDDGELSAGLDPHILTAMLYAPVYHGS